MKRRGCHRCGAPVIAGTDDIGVDVELDAATLSLVGEALAVIDGRRTWLYTIGGRRTARELWLRTRHHIGTDPGASDLHTSHDCAQAVPAAWITTPAPAPAGQPEEVPF